MSTLPFPYLHKTVTITFGATEFAMAFHSQTAATMTMVRGVHAGVSEELTIAITPLRTGQFVISWQRTNKTTAVHVHDYQQKTVHSFVTTPEDTFLHLVGTLAVKE